MSNDSHRQIFKSTAITGGATATVLLVGLAKVKVLAIIGGPAAVGLMGLLQNIMTAIATVAGCGLANSGVRSIAADAADAGKVANLWRTMIAASAVLGILAAIVLTLNGRQIGTWLMNTPMSSMESLILSLGVVATLLLTTQTALLQGLRRINDLAVVNILSAVVGACISLVPVVLKWNHAIIWYVVISPICSASITFVILHLKRALPSLSTVSPQSTKVLWPLFKLGLPIVAASIVTIGTQLVARSLVFNHLGVDAAGHFQAAWSVSTTYIGFVLSAMAADYFPRLSAMNGQHQSSARLVNQQTDMALTISAPFVLSLIAFSPVVISLLYSSEFKQAHDLLRWQAVGDVLKVLCWPMGYILLAAGKGRLFILAEVVWSGAYLASLQLLMPEHGINVAGIGFAVAYLVLLIYLAAMSWLLIGFRISNHNLVFGAALSGIGLAIISTATVPQATYYHAAAVLLVTVYAFFHLDQLIDLRDIVRKRLARAGN
jgi:O-antigen/teichoic acid export membrane protein